MAELASRRFLVCYVVICTTDGGGGNSCITNMNCSLGLDVKSERHATSASILDDIKGMLIEEHSNVFKQEIEPQDFHLTSITLL
jgi:hypothetical protein